MNLQSKPAYCLLSYTKVAFPSIIYWIYPSDSVTFKHISELPLKSNPTSIRPNHSHSSSTARINHKYREQRSVLKRRSKWLKIKGVKGMY